MIRHPCCGLPDPLFGGRPDWPPHSGHPRPGLRITRTPCNSGRGWSGTPCLRLVALHCLASSWTRDGWCMRLIMQDEKDLREVRQMRGLHGPAVVEMGCRAASFCGSACNATPSCSSMHCMLPASTARAPRRGLLLDGPNQEVCSLPVSGV
eukprot:350406-Chlamydomonas_euryale.AAC.5